MIPVKPGFLRGDMIKAVFVDIDNTLLSFDGYVKQCMKEGFQKYELKQYEPYMFDVFVEENGNLWKQLEKGQLTFEHLEEIRWQKILDRLGIDFDGLVFERYFREGLYNSAILEKNALEIIQYLNQKYILCLASNGPYFQQCNRIKQAHLDRYFELAFISEKFGCSKPSKDFFDCSFQELNEYHKQTILPQETYIIGDSLSSDMQGGINYGMHTIFYKRNKDIIVPKTVEHVIEDLIDIKNIL